MNYLEQVRDQLLQPNSQLEVIQAGKIYTSKELRQLVELYMGYLSSLKLEPSAHIALMPERTVEWICFMYAVMFKGYAPLLIDTYMDESTLSGLITNEVLIFDKHERTSGELFIHGLPDISSHNESIDNLESTYIYKDRPLFSVHTSGTTGMPKKVVYTNENIAWAVNEYARIYNFKHTTTILFSLPYHYCYSVIPCCIVPFALGKRIVIAPELSTTDDIAKLIQIEHIQILVVNPVFYAELSRSNLAEYDFSSLTLCDSGGESIPLSVARSIEAQTSVLITEGYGLTETTSLTHFLLPDDEGMLRLGSVGRACHGVETCIVDSVGKDVEVGMIGELYVRGAMVARYDNETANSDSSRWFATGDLFYKDQDDFFYFVSRKKDVPDIEASILLEVSRAAMEVLSLDDITDVTYVFDEQKSPVLFVVSAARSNKQIIEEAILNVFPESMRKSLMIRHVASLPRTSTGKVKKRDL